MDCQECQNRPATLYFTQIINGNKKEIHVCEICAKEKGYFPFEEDNYSFQDLLKGLFEPNSPQLKVNNQHAFSREDEIHCPKCHLTYRDFRKVGKFGCAKCYHTFENKINSIFRRVHSGNTEHNGKIPLRRHVDLQHKREIDALRKELANMIKHEEFEKAAVIRDQIKELQYSEDGKDGDKS